MSEIDVSKCVFYNNGKCNNPNCTACDCCNNVDCYYKQLQQLKAKIQGFCQGGCAIYQFDKIEELKRENESYEYQLQKRVEICDIWMNLSNQYKQCLDEIEEIVEEASEDYRMPEEVWNKILQLIKQAKEGE